MISSGDVQMVVDAKATATAGIISGHLAILSMRYSCQGFYAFLGYSVME